MLDLLYRQVYLKVCFFFSFSLTVWKVRVNERMSETPHWRLRHLWASSAAVWRWGCPGWGSWLWRSARPGGSARPTAPSPSGGGGERPASARPLSAPPCPPSAWTPPLASAGPSGRGRASHGPLPPATGEAPPPGRPGSACRGPRPWSPSTRFQSLHGKQGGKVDRLSMDSETERLQWPPTPDGWWGAPAVPFLPTDSTYCQLECARLSRPWMQRAGSGIRFGPVKRTVSLCPLRPLPPGFSLDVQLFTLLWLASPVQPIKRTLGATGQLVHFCLTNTMW